MTPAVYQESYTAVSISPLLTRRLLHVGPALHYGLLRYSLTSGFAHIQTTHPGKSKFPQPPRRTIYFRARQLVQFYRWPGTRPARERGIADGGRYFFRLPFGAFCDRVADRGNICRPILASSGDDLYGPRARRRRDDVPASDQQGGSLDRVRCNDTAVDIRRVFRRCKERRDPEPDRKGRFARGNGPDVFDAVSVDGD